MFFSLRSRVPLLLLLSVLLSRAVPVAGQELSVELLVNLTELHPGQHADLGDWSFAPRTPQAAGEPLTWSWPPGQESDSTQAPPLLQMSLRPAPRGYDVVLYIRRLAPYNQLRHELEKQRLVPLPVTCLGGSCLGFRFQLPSCTVVFYEGKPGPYPFLVVVQPRAGRAPLPAPPVPASPPKKTRAKALITPLIAPAPDPNVSVPTSELR